ncbi:MAG: hypothetical protein P8R02_12225 [Pseudomonadales bacterium]|nr:hypothetical protein [Pseudomonadales bacterium]
MEMNAMRTGKVKTTLNLFISFFISFFVSLCALLGPAMAFAADSASTSKLSDQHMANSPEALIKALADISFLTPEETQAKLEIEFGDMLQPLNLIQAPQILDPA